MLVACSILYLVGLLVYAYMLWLRRRRRQVRRTRRVRSYFQ